jgi:hypothetical protein
MRETSLFRPLPGNSQGSRTIAGTDLEVVSLLGARNGQVPGRCRFQVCRVVLALVVVLAVLVLVDLVVLVVLESAGFDERGP